MLFIIHDVFNIHEVSRWNTFWILFIIVFKSQDPQLSSETTLKPGAGSRMSFGGDWGMGRHIPRSDFRRKKAITSSCTGNIGVFRWRRSWTKICKKNCIKIEFIFFLEFKNHGGLVHRPPLTVIVVISVSSQLLIAFPTDKQ